MEDLIKQIEALLMLHAYEMEGIPDGMPTAREWMEAVDKVQAELERVKSYPVIQAKALRKKGTDEFYFYHEKDGWFTGEIPELHYNNMDFEQMVDYYNQPFCHPVPADAALVDIKIIIES